VYGPLLIGFALGIILTALAARVIAIRHLRRVRAAERRARSSERLAEIGAMTSGLAHEIKNPLSTIGLNAQLLAEGLEEIRDRHPDEVRRLGNRVGALRREAERLRGILADFLEFAGQLRPDLREDDLRSAIEEVVEFYRPEAERLSVRLRADLGDEPVLIRFDARLIKQAVLNLLLNATQAMSTPGPAVNAHSQHDARPAGVGQSGGGGGGGGASGVGELMLRLARGKEEDRRRVVRLEVIDTGPGMSQEVLARIFEPYFTTKPGGSGLGLPTSRRLIEAHGGHLEVQSEPGRGTRFIITLPVLGPASPAAAAGQPPAAGALHKP
jgi:signal transduction histidine kinase